MFKFLYNKNQVYKDTYYLYQYNDNNIRIVHNKYTKLKGFEELKTSIISKIESDEIERISISRTRRNIREIALSNGFEYFATLTINSQYCDRFHLTECQTLLRQKLKKLKRKNSNFAYIFITEKHTNGAFHFHGLVKGIDDFYVNKYGYLSHSIFDEIGFNSFSQIRDLSRVSNYILKYITKDCVKNEQGTVYISSRGLKKADRYEIKPIQLNWTYNNDFCDIIDIDLTKTDKDLLIRLQYITEKR